MGLDTSHDCWHGAYSAFMRWRQMLAHVAGLPPLELMEGFFDKERAVFGNPFWKQFEDDTRHNYVGEETIWHRLPIRWSCLRPDPLHELLNHSDCDGKLPWESCAGIARSLQRLVKKLPEGDAGGHIEDWREKTRIFIKGLRLAAKNKEDVDFH